MREDVLQANEPQQGLAGGLLLEGVGDDVEGDAALLLLLAGSLIPGAVVPKHDDLNTVMGTVKTN